jgi:hypothetical protein
METTLWNPVGFANVELPPVRFGDLTQDEFTDLSAMLGQWSRCLRRNRMREQYYNGRNRLKDLGISIPPQLRSIETVIGWPAKAVDVLAARSQFDGFVSPSGGLADEVSALFARADFGLTYAQALTDELVHSCSFITCTGGLAGEPRVLLSAHSAQTATALWDGRRKRLKCGLIIMATDAGQPTGMYVFAPDCIVSVTYDGFRWRAEKATHRVGTAPMEVLAHRPSVRRPFGKSRISRAVMTLTDSAVRCALRSEVAAEFFTTPQKYLLGIDQQAADSLNKWEAYLGNILTVTTGERDEAPTFGQLPQMTMQPHVDYMRSLAARFAGETNIPVSSLGIIHDNPSSAEAIYAAKEDLIIDAQALNASNSRALRNLALMAASAITGRPVDALDDAESDIMPRFKNPALPSPVSQADAMVKQIAAIPWIGGSRVALEQLGYTEEQITRLLSDRRRTEALKALDGLLEGSGPRQRPASATDAQGEGAPGGGSGAVA